MELIDATGWKVLQTQPATKKLPNKMQRVLNY